MTENGKPKNSIDTRVLVVMEGGVVSRVCGTVSRAPGDPGVEVSVYDADNAEDGADAEEDPESCPPLSPEWQGLAQRLGVPCADGVPAPGSENVPRILICVRDGVASIESSGGADPFLFDVDDQAMKGALRVDIVGIPERFVGLVAEAGLSPGEGAALRPG